METARLSSPQNSGAKNADYRTVYFNMTENIKKAFDENGIEIPFNQLDVHVKNN